MGRRAPPGRGPRRRVRAGPLAPGRGADLLSGGRAFALVLDEEARVPPEALPAPPPPTHSFTNPDGGFALGRSLLRALTEGLHVALDPDASHAARRAITTLDAVENGLGVPTSAPGLGVTRDTPRRLQVRRGRHPGEVTLTVSTTTTTIVMTRGGALTHIERFRWSEARNCFTLGEAGEGAELFEALRAAILEELYPEVTLPR